MSEKTFKIVGDDISDGYHTFGELYDHRCMLFVTLCLILKDRACWRQDLPGWFLMYLETPEGQVSYHIPIKFIYLVRHVIREDKAIVWDGHTSKDALERLRKVSHRIGNFDLEQEATWPT